MSKSNKYKNLQEIIKAQLEYVQQGVNTIEEAEMIIRIWMTGYIEDIAKKAFESGQLIKDIDFDNNITWTYDTFEEFLNKNKIN